MRFAMIVLLLWMTGCTAHMKPMRPQLEATLQTIDVAEIEMSKMIHIRRLNILTALMGSSGLLFEQMVAAENDARYHKKVGEIATKVSKLFQENLFKGLEKQGYTIRYSNKPFWDYFKPSQAPLRNSSDGILRIQFLQQGFLSSGLQSDYIPTVFISAELIHPNTREILYHDQFASGFSAKDLKMLSLYFGETRLMNNPEGTSSYHDVNEIIRRSSESSQDILSTINFSALHITKGLKRPEPKAFALSEEEDHSSALNKIDSPSLNLLHQIKSM